MARKLPLQSFDLPRKRGQFRRLLHDIQENAAPVRYNLQGLQGEDMESLFDVLDRISTPRHGDIFIDQATSHAFTAKAEKLKDQILRTDDEDSVFEKLKACGIEEDRPSLREELLKWKRDSFEPAMVEFDAVAGIWGAQLKLLKSVRSSVGRKQQARDPLNEAVEAVQLARAIFGLPPDDPAAIEKRLRETGASTGGRDENLEVMNRAVRECEDTIAKLNNARILLNTIASHAIEISGGKSGRELT